MFDYIVNSKLIDNVEKINLTILGGGNLIKSNDVTVLHEGSANEWEFPTINLIRQFSITCDQPYNILYLHNAGVICPYINECLEDRRKYNMYFLVNRWKYNTSILVENDTCGCDLRTDPILHYSGNMWWSKTDHIKTLDIVENLPLILTNRHKTEFWVCHKSKKHHSLWDCGISVYERHLHRYLPHQYESI